MYQDFVAKNTSDTHQVHNKTFKFSDCEQRTQKAYFLTGDDTSVNTLLYIASLFNLVWPIVMYIEWTSIQRYEVTILKKVKLN